MALVQISLKDLMKMTRHWKIVQDPDVLCSLINVLIEDNSPLIARKLSSMLDCTLLIVDWKSSSTCKMALTSTNSKQLPQATFYCQNVIDSDFFNNLLLAMKSDS